MDSKWVAWRTAFLAAFILSMMVNTNYSASLVSSLLSTPTKNIKTTRDLIDSSVTFGAEEISYNVPFFAVSIFTKYKLCHLFLTSKMLIDLRGVVHILGRFGGHCWVHWLMKKKLFITSLCENIHQITVFQQNIFSTLFNIFISWWSWYGNSVNDFA